jgi:hypothetical protein
MDDNIAPESTNNTAANSGTSGNPINTPTQQPSNGMLPTNYAKPLPTVDKLKPFSLKKTNLKDCPQCPHCVSHMSMEEPKGFCSNMAVKSPTSSPPLSTTMSLIFDQPGFAYAARQINNLLCFTCRGSNIHVPSDCKAIYH